MKEQLVRPSLTPASTHAPPVLLSAYVTRAYLELLWWRRRRPRHARRRQLGADAWDAGVTVRLL
eukprot:365439-Chlamydomonas_euryale.AAC.3